MVQNKTNIRKQIKQARPLRKIMFPTYNVNMHHVRFEVPRLWLIPDGFPQILAMLTQRTCLSINVALKQLHTHTQFASNFAKNLIASEQC